MVQKFTMFMLVVSFGFFAAPVSAAGLQPCGKDSAKTGQTLRVSGSDIPIRSGPTTKSDKIINQKATEIFRKTHYATIDNTVVVFEECTQAGWSKISVSEPEWLRESHRGWVPSKFLRGQKIQPGGFTVFTEEDFLWDKKTAPYKKTIVQGVNKIHRENSRCKDIDPSSAYISGGKGTKTDPIFYVTCGKNAAAFNVFFSKADVEAGNRFAAAEHIQKTRAVDLCEAYAKANAAHPSTVYFSRIMNLAISEHPNGRTAVTSSFTAKNSFNLELKFNIKCLLDRSGLLEANIAEAR